MVLRSYDNLPKKLRKVKYSMKEATIIWFRKDLRLEDNPAFTAACERGEALLPVYIWCPEEEGNWSLGAASRWWLHHSLTALQAELKVLGLPLIIRHGPALDTLKQLIKDSHAKAVFWNRRYEPASLKRDTEVKKNLLEEVGVEVRSFQANLLFEPWTVTNKEGKPFQVFTPFWKSCLSKPEPLAPLPLPKKIPSGAQTSSLSVDELQLLPKIAWDEEIKKTWTPGTIMAKKYLKTFLHERVQTYHEDRDFPCKEGVSFLSPYLHFGEISPRMIWQTVRTAHLKGEGPDCFLKQLGWREFAHHLLFHFPETPEEPLRAQFLKFPWSQNQDHLSLWQKGKTGYPIVDAGMRQLWKTGYMHNRVRMIVGSFLVKDLLLSWTCGAAWFWDTLVDADLANNTLGWQWVGGCGADAAPYFRIFNPITQGKKFDPEGEYVRRWIPEISGLSNQWIHNPWEAPEIVLRQAGIILGKDYPRPIVDHNEARIKALEIFKSLS